MVVIVMGVAGAGKTAVGSRLADALGWSFYDADDLHPARNIGKMASGIPLSDEDRRPWLESLLSLVTDCGKRGENAVLACSALRQAYRDTLTSAGVETVTVYLKADPSLARERLSVRRGHYMPAQLLDSQYEILEEPDRAIVVPAEWEPGRIVEAILASLRA
jgi:gluconokinase